MTSAQALSNMEQAQQLALSQGWLTRLKAEAEAQRRRDERSPICAGCREREARYGFRAEGDAADDRPRTLCFSCFRIEVHRRQAVAERMARGWNAEQASLPLRVTLDSLAKRRGRAQIAARRALRA